jgi:cytochrome c553
LDSTDTHMMSCVRIDFSLNSAPSGFAMSPWGGSVMVRKLIAATLVGLLGTIGAAEAAGDAAAGKTKSAACVGCHGDKGQGVAPNPALAGKSDADLVKALKDYKSGTKPNPIMNGLAAALSDQDMEDLAAFYASLK